MMLSGDLSIDETSQKFSKCLISISMFNFFFAPSPLSSHNPGPLSQVSTDFSNNAATRVVVSRLGQFISSQTPANDCTSTTTNLLRPAEASPGRVQPTCTLVLVPYVFCFLFSILFIICSYRCYAHPVRMVALQPPARTCTVRSCMFSFISLILFTTYYYRWPLTMDDDGYRHHLCSQ